MKGQGGGGAFDLCANSEGGGGGGGGSSYTGSAAKPAIVDGALAPDGSRNGEALITYTVASTSYTGAACNTNATPELGSGELLSTGLLPIGAVLLYRRRRARRATQQQ